MKNRIAGCVLFILLAVNGYSEKNLDLNVFSFDRRVDNSYVDDYTFESNPDYFSKFFAIDAACYQKTGVFYGVGSEKSKNLIYYSDLNRNYKFFGINLKTGERALKLVDKVAATRSGRFYCIDALEEKIYFWNIDGDTFRPAGRIEKKFEDLEDICVDAHDNLCILDAKAKKIYQYSSVENRLLDFCINYGAIESFTWGRARGLAVSGGYIYVVFEHGIIIKLDEEGQLQKKYGINISNLGLFVRNNKDISQCWTESITL